MFVLYPPREKELGTYLEMGFYIGVTGFVCKEMHGRTLREMVSWTICFSMRDKYQDRKHACVI